VRLKIHALNKFKTTVLIHAGRPPDDWTSFKDYTRKCRVRKDITVLCICNIWK